MMTDMSETGNQDAGLLAHARARPDHIALRQGDQARTYSELDSSHAACDGATAWR